MVKTLKRLAVATAAALSTPALVFISVAHAATATTVVTPSNNQGWNFNPDPANSTPYEFNEDEASIGEGSLYVKPIGSNPLHKFIASKDLDTSVADFKSLSYDYQIAGNGVASDSDQFYLNVYTNLPGSNTFYDCRFDYVPSEDGSTTEFTTATFTAADTPNAIGDRADTFTCPATLAAMPEGSTISAITLNVGDTGGNDEGLAGYLDNVVISIGDTTTTYDFEEDLKKLNDKEACKNGGWMTSEAPEFKNQGACVSHFASKGKARGHSH